MYTYYDYEAEIFFKGLSLYVYIYVRDSYKRRSMTEYLRASTIMKPKLSAWRPMFICIHVQPVPWKMRLEMLN